MLEQWQPANDHSQLPPTTAQLRQLSECQDPKQLTDDAVIKQAKSWIALSESDWQPILADMSADELIGLAFFYTRAEMCLQGFDSLASNPAIWVFRELKQSGRLPDKAVIRALKAETNNRFIPYGSVVL
ncbi:MAG: hypothetical protein P1U57_14635 [Oleibacter sp.]|nr:hypothetical protein [Thalassolituus sp.]